MWPTLLVARAVTLFVQLVIVLLSEQTTL